MSESNSTRYYNEDSRRPHGEYCYLCGEKDAATKKRLYPQSQYQLCLHCYTRQQRIDAFYGRYAHKIAEMSNNTFNKFLVTFNEFLDEVGPQAGYFCGLCGSLLKVYSTGSVGSSSLLLISCPSCREFASFMPRRDRRGLEDATKEEVAQKRKQVVEAAGLIIKAGAKPTPLDEPELSKAVETLGFSSLDEFHEKDVVGAFLEEDKIGQEVYPEGPVDEVMTRITGGRASISFGTYRDSGLLIVLSILVKFRMEGVRLARPTYPLKRLRLGEWRKEMMDLEAHSLFAINQDEPERCVSISAEVENLFVFPSVRDAQQATKVLQSL